jgi:hypothetical protein
VKKKGKMVVEEKSPNKEGVLGPVGFGPQAQSGEAHGQCKGPISGSMHNPALHLPGGSNLTIPSQFHHCHVLDLLRGRIVVGNHGCKVIAVHDVCDWDKRK